MKAVILAGGFGTRLSEETVSKPKPMVEIGGYPILWHILKYYGYYGINDFIICCGYKGYMIKEYFANYSLHMSDVTIEMKTNTIKVHHKRVEPWSVTLVDTGENAMTGGRLLSIREYVSSDEMFCFTYGDGLADLDISSLIEFHKSHGKIATLTATYPPGRFGNIDIENGFVKKFKEKPKGDGTLINGGYFVLNPKVFDYLKDSQTVWEEEPLSNLAKDNELMAFEHHNFWHAMDTMRDKNHLEGLWNNSQAPWKKWK